MKCRAKPESKLISEDVIRQLLASDSVCDLRKGNDLARLHTLSQGPWAGRFAFLGFGGNPDGSFTMLCRVHTTGLVWQGEALPHDVFTFAAVISRYYPLSLPRIKFADPVPYCPHVVHKEFLPPMAHVPTEFQEYVRKGGHGNCCYLRASQWSSDSATHNLAVVAWQVSRVLTLGKAFGEAQSLNPAARDHARRLAEDHRLPLGDSLPYPHDDEQQQPTVLCGEKPEDVIEWEAPNRGTGQEDT